ncbi:hypothetical protein FRB94_010695 [Tulasnella sp. JGI-2019a]|nr:hypothetical protein FRB93_009771 [Tulasnella sp. JGI-2019a]KAG8993591.1 hypothetical protein FRB94_010695 [Tulasnella sp. JGI-2019a]
MALNYKETLQHIAPGIEFLMTLYLTPSLTPEEIRKAKAAGIVGVKSYPHGVTTNSDQGVSSYEMYYPVFKAMEEEDMVLNLHGEVPSDADTNACVLNAEPLFLPKLVSLHSAFPNLRIVLEHATTRAAVECVKSLGDNVACTITAHHLELTVDDWAGQAFNFCKPVAKYPDDRKALREVVHEGHPRFFLGSDSAPHPHTAKTANISQVLQLHSSSGNSSPAPAPTSCAAGVYTSPILLPLVAELLESFGALSKLQGFVSTNGRKFYKREPDSKCQGITVTLKKESKNVPLVWSESHGVEHSVVPFRAGKSISWHIVSRSGI